MEKSNWKDSDPRDSNNPPRGAELREEKQISEALREKVRGEYLSQNELTLPFLPCFFEQKEVGGQKCLALGVNQEVA